MSTLICEEKEEKAKNLTKILNQQALAADKLYPKIEFFAKGYGPGDCILFTFIKSFIIWSTDIAYGRKIVFSALEIL